MASSIRFARAAKLERFPRWRVWNRVLAHATEDMATLGGAVLVAVAFALVGAFAVFPRGANWFARFSAGLGVAAMALVAAWGLVLGYRTLRYRRRGDPVWEIAWSLRETQQSGGVSVRVNGVSLICRGRPPVSVSTLGHVEAVVRPPNGRIRQMPQEGMGGDAGTTLWFAPALEAGPFTPGPYEVRWYGTTARRRRYEIARSKFMVPDDSLDA
jgi:hypothetical protein